MKLRGVLSKYFFVIVSLTCPLLLAAQQERWPGSNQSKEIPKNNPCANPNLKDVDEVYACMVYWHRGFKWGTYFSFSQEQYDSYLESYFRPTEECTKLQRFLHYKITVGSGGTEDQFHREDDLKEKDPDSVKLVDCAVIADVMEHGGGQRPYWDHCDEYATSENKVEHLRTCLLNFPWAVGVRRPEDVGKKLASMGCDDIKRAYERALGRVYHTYFPPEAGGRGYKLPPSYHPLTCEDIMTINFVEEG